VKLFFFFFFGAGGSSAPPPPSPRLLVDSEDNTKRTDADRRERERRTHVHTRTLYILRRAMASALRVPATTVATVGRSKALLIDVCRRSRPCLVESSIRARRASSSSCGNWLPHRFLVASPPLGGRRRSTAAAAAQWRGLRRPAGLSMLSLRASSTGWLLLPPPSYAVERRSFSRSTSTQAVIAAPPPPKTGTL
jgi:hypothetical protein